ncbi:MAG: 2-phospho-L-lactate guanylyltransferase [Pseudomonadales bacterium]|nr:2-phospho-L-lactate guanylyltransferase [Pseudomonadales bacterium]
MWVIIPVKDLDKAKTRLAGSLCSEERKQFCLAILRDQIAALKSLAAVSHIILLSRDKSCRELAAETAIELLTLETDTGLNEGLTAALEILYSRGCRQAMILHGDIPLLGSEAIGKLIDIHQTSGGLTLVPSNKKDGTNIMAIDLPLKFRLNYGASSLDKHIKEAGQNSIGYNIVQDDNLGLDIDTDIEFNTLENTKQIPHHCAHFLELRRRKKQENTVADNRNTDPVLQSIATL